MADYAAARLIRPTLLHCQQPPQRLERGGIRKSVDPRGAEVALERRHDAARGVVIVARDLEPVAETRQALLQLLDLGAAIVGRERAPLAERRRDCENRQVG